MDGALSMEMACLKSRAGLSRTLEVGLASGRLLGGLWVAIHKDLRLSQGLQ